MYLGLNGEPSSRVGEMMQVESVTSDYSNISNIKDLPESFFSGKAKNPLFIATREGQVTRVDKQIVTRKKGTVVGTWQLGELGYLNKDGTINIAKFKQHEMIFAASPKRIHPKFREGYTVLLSQLERI